MRKFEIKLGSLLLAGALVAGSFGTVDAKAYTSYDCDLAEEIDVNERIDGELTEADNPDEYDVYKFTTGKGKITDNWYYITFKDMNRESPNVIGAKLYLYDEDMNELDYIDASSDELKACYAKLESNTDYYIVVTHRLSQRGNPCEYYFEVEERTDEAGESLDDAADIKVNTKYTSYFQAPSEYDVYKFKVTTNSQKINVKNCHKKVSSTRDIKWEVLDEDGIAVKDVKDTFYGVSAEESKDYDVKLEPGVYYIRFKADSNMKLEETSETKYIFSIEEASAKSSDGSSMIISTLTMSKGDSVTLEACFSDKGTCSWSSSKSSIVKVTSSGKITAKKKGTAKVTCKNKKTGEKMVLKVVVK